MDLSKPYDPSYVENIEPGDPKFWAIGAPGYWLNQNAPEETGEVDVNLPNPTAMPGVNHGQEHESGEDIVNS